MNGVEFFCSTGKSKPGRSNLYRFKAGCRAFMSRDGTVMMPDRQTQSASGSARIFRACPVLSAPVGRDSARSKVRDAVGALHKTGNSGSPGPPQPEKHFPGHVGERDGIVIAHHGGRVRHWHPVGAGSPENVRGLELEVR